jgi:hypothetical protein
MIMRRQKIDHILRAAASATGQKRFVLIGSSALIVQAKRIPAEMMITPEADIFAPDAEDVEYVSDLIDGSIGRNSAFHNTFGYYGDGVSPQTAILPLKWPDRAIEYSTAETGEATAIVVEAHDLALAKLCAWRDKDKAWLKAGVQARVFSLEVMASRLGEMPEHAPSATELLLRFEFLAQSASVPFDKSRFEARTQGQD